MQYKVVQSQVPCVGVIVDFKDPILSFSPYIVAHSVTRELLSKLGANNRGVHMGINVISVCESNVSGTIGLYRVQESLRYESGEDYCYCNRRRENCLARSSRRISS